MICGGKTLSVKNKCQYLDQDGAWKEQQMVEKRREAGSSLYGPQDDMLVTGGRSTQYFSNSEKEKFYQSTEIFGTGNTSPPPDLHNKTYQHCQAGLDLGSRILKLLFQFRHYSDKGRVFVIGGQDENEEWIGKNYYTANQGDGTLLWMEYGLQFAGKRVHPGCMSAAGEIIFLSSFFIFIIFFVYIMK